MSGEPLKARYHLQGYFDVVVRVFLQDSVRMSQFSMVCGQTHSDIYKPTARIPSPDIIS